MTKNEYLSKLTYELKKNKISDAADIVNEYEQHFSFKLADGYSEEEISAKLGDPTLLAAQFKQGAESSICRKSTLAIIGLFFVDLFAGVVFLLLAAWEIVMAAFSLVLAAATVCLLGGLNIYALIPPMPYWCGAVFGLAFAALSILTIVGCIYYAAFLRQLLRSFGRFHHNTVAAASGKPVLPSLTISPKLSAKANRRLRTIALISISAFAICFILAFIVSALSAGTLGFWHSWGWFGYTG